MKMKNNIRKFLENMKDINGNEREGIIGGKKCKIWYKK